MYIYLCENSLEGIFTAIYNIYANKHNLPQTCIAFREETVLFAEYIRVKTDLDKVEKVTRTILREFGEEDYYHICMALTSSDEEKGTYLYQTILYGLKNKVGQNHLFDALAVSGVNNCFKLGRAAAREVHHYMGFVRFRELENGIMYAEIAPKHDLIPYIMPHFVDRFPGENFVIHDSIRRLYGIHPKFKEWVMINAEDAWEGMVDFNKMKSSSEEELFEALFRYFHEKIAIKDRKNLKLQQNNLPLRFRDNMTEFQMI